MESFLFAHVRTAFRPVENPYQVKVDKSSNTDYKWGMETGAPLTVNVQLMTDVLLEIAQERSLEQLLQKLVCRALGTPEALIVIVWLIDNGEGHAAVESKEDPSCQTRYLYAVAGGTSTDSLREQSVRLPDHLARIPLGIGPIGKVATTKQPLTINDLDKATGELFFTLDWVKAQHIRGFNCVPIICRDEVLGVYGVFDRNTPPEGAVRWARIFADYIAASIVITRSFEEIRRLKTQLEQQNAYLREEVVEAKAFGDIVGQSTALEQVIHQIDLVAPTDASVLILGETGTGKELVAHEIHRRSRRRDASLVRVNCASVPRELYESEFFGHAKGAFTGAFRDRAGRFETAEGGTLFLDEIAEVPVELQSKLLRVLQEKRYERVGEDRTRHADVRIIAATNRDMKKEVESGRFRQDLYYRLNVFPIQVAPLRDRKEDIPLLAQHFVQQSVKEMRCSKPRLTRIGILRLQNYDWPGNVRELRNVIERAVILARGGVLEFDLPICDAQPVTRLQSSSPHDLQEFLTESELRQRERDNLLTILEKTRWKIKGPDGAAELLGVNATTLLSRMKSMHIKRPK
ncbi:MAG: sigma 54-interacting transcriptional regulator [Sedimentisphaerales bacterium]|nr:sigma 54-interacting transcriptional regulator [Sedimentisphaerales bacterium]